MDDRQDETSPPTSTGHLDTIWLKRVRRGPMDRQDSVLVDAGKGLRGNANRGSKRQITLLSGDAWDAVQDDLGTAVDPALRRANLLIRGLDLADSRGKILRIGDCRIEIWGETRPCRLMEESHPGLQSALDPDWRGGAYGRALDDGEIRLGDPVTWLSRD